MDERSDRDLVTASCGGNRTAYALLVRRHHHTVFLVCLGVLGNVHDAEDVAQDTMLKGFERIRQLRDGGQFAGWVVAIARNLSINLLRQRKITEKAINGRPPGGMGLQPMSHRQDADATEDRGQDARDTGAGEDLERAVARLPWDLRLPLVMYYFDGQDVPTVARRLEISTSGVYAKLRAAIQELHETLTTQGDRR